MLLGIRLLYLYLFVISLSGCAAISKKSYLESHKGQRTKSIFILDHGWHTGIVVKISDIPGLLLPEKNDFPKERFLEIGWGDEDFYQAGTISTLYGLKAAFFPTDSVLHLVGFHESVELEYPASGITQLTVTEAGFLEMLSTIHHSIDRGGKNRSSPLRKGLYGNSYFYKGLGTYHFFMTCNHWTAETLEKTGVPINTFFAFTSGSVISQVSKYGMALK